MAQALKKGGEARRAALSAAYGSDARTAWVGGHEGRTYELGPEPPPGDIDGRSPAVVTWAEGDLFFLIASDRLPAARLLDIAAGMYR